MRYIRVSLFLRHLRAFLVLLLAASPALSCKHFGGSGGLGARIVRCGEQALVNKGITYIGKVNDVLANPAISDGEAKVRLIDLGVDAGQDVIGCILRDQGAKFAESAATNTRDRVSAQASERASARLAELEAEGWKFEP